ncbi:glutaredoxin family protein [Cryobacterium sp. TMT2-18-3]|uniref:glutaredoxin family protein n=1 Tax=unclassified Cryobacterium TaxID=2649013 RepID=UPI00106D4D0D|nr:MULTISPECIES: glutaredoxin family protein [unclassified Cryobacterium]TFC26512.1 glutaredoxin family protein [Cryobacterium sp. TMT2-18-2]TFC36206.1 glutaredoxin family protein [Cryobacterium sp. TMT2-42-4]TFC68067.1 glutaredoxin family protein [Cryobacterium sp. TMT2-18-3]
MSDLAAPPAPDAQRLTMFGAEWCGDCRRSKKFLDARNVDYDYVDLLLVGDGADRALAISGRTQIPVILFPDGTHVVEPSDSMLHAKLTQLGSIR